MHKKTTIYTSNKRFGRSKSVWDSTGGSYSNTVLEDGSVAVVSKNPIKERIQHVFCRSCGFDNNSNKGFVYTKIEKDEIVYIGGDLNINKNSSSGEFQNMLKNLNVNDIDYKGHPSPWDSQTNDIA